MEDVNLCLSGVVPDHHGWCVMVDHHDRDRPSSALITAARFAYTTVGDRWATAAMIVVEEEE